MKIYIDYEYAAGLLCDLLHLRVDHVANFSYHIAKESA